MKKEAISVLSGILLVCLMFSVYAACTDNQRIMKLSSATNAHGEKWDQLNYGVPICFNELFPGEIVPVDPHRCTGGNLLLKLSDNTNAHAGNSTSGYSVDVCYVNLQCSIKTSCDGDGEKAVVYMSSRTNAHLSNNSASTYQYKVCCKYFPTQEICNDEIDNDEDGDTDCADSDCDVFCAACEDIDEDYYIPGSLNQTECGDICGPGNDEPCVGNNDANDNDDTVNPSAPEICDDGKDNDQDGNSDCDDLIDCLETCVADIGVRGCRVEPMSSFWILQNDVEVEVNHTDCKLSLDGGDLRCCPEGFSCTDFEEDECQCLAGGVARCSDYSQTECESFDYSVAEFSVENDLNKSDGFCGSLSGENYVDCVCWWDGNSCEPQWEIINLDTNQSEGVCSVSGTQTECDDQGFKTLSYTVNQPAPIGCTAPSEIRTRCFVATEVPFFNLLSLVGVIGLLIVLYSIRKVL